MEKRLKNIIAKLELRKEERRRHSIYTFYVDGERIGQFGLSRSSKESRIPKYASNQLQIDAALFNQIADCTAGLEDAMKHIKEKKEKGIV